MKMPALYFVRTLGVMVVMPVVFLVLYPVVYMMLPETMARLADLPRDLILFVLVVVVVVPLSGVLLYFRARQGKSKKGIREAGDTRDVL